MVLDEVGEKRERDSAQIQRIIKIKLTSNCENSGLIEKVSILSRCFSLSLFNQHLCFPWPGLSLIKIGEGSLSPEPSACTPLC
jgi:hypothetical protein